MTEPQAYQRALAMIDDANARDPKRISVGAEQLPAELVYGQRMTAWLERVAPDASEALRIAVRAQHLRRWEIGRASYPMTRAGYHQWRTRLASFHAEKAGEIMAEAGYGTDFITRVQSLIRKEKIKTDPEAQTLEDVACLVFLEDDFVEFAARHEAPKVIDILKRTWKKMSEQGHAHALALSATLPPAARDLIAAALAPAAPGPSHSGMGEETE